MNPRLPRRIVLNLRDRRSIWSMPGSFADQIRAAAPSGWEVVDVDALADGQGDGGSVAPEALEAVRDAEIYIGFGVPPDLLRAGPGLRWIHTASAGVGGALHDEMLRSDVVLTNSAGVHAVPMAEWVMGAVLYFARGFDFAVRMQRAGRWEKAAFDRADTAVHEVGGRTIGILGLGGIGREVAVRARSLGMRVMATRRRSTPAPEGVDLRTDPADVPDVVRQSDYLVVCVPETERTRGMVNERALSWMQPSAVLINVARGGVVDEQALIAALAAGTLRGAALDVFQREPLPADSPLWRFANVLMTPHVSATSDRFWLRQADLVTENLRRYIADETLYNVVDKEAGY